jgi:hypothetical protein
MDSAIPPLDIHRLHGNRHRQLHRAGHRDYPGMGDLLAAPPARHTTANGPLFVRDALYREMPQRERVVKRLSAGEMNPLVSKVHGK